MNGANINCEQSSNVDFSHCCFLETLPIELIRFLVGRYCDGRSLSTFWLAVSASTVHQSCATLAVVGALQDRLNELRAGFSDHDRDQTALIMDYFLPVRTIANSDNKLLSDRIGQWSALLSFFEEYGYGSTCNSDNKSNTSNSSYNNTPNKEWPVWCGTLFVSTHVKMANVIVTTSTLGTKSMRNWRLFMAQQRERQWSFSPEPRRFVPLGPLGCIRGLSRCDSKILSQISHQQTMEQYDDVLLPPSSFMPKEGPLKEIRIISRQQAIDRLRVSGFQSRCKLAALGTSAAATDYLDCLLAFWNDTEDDVIDQGSLISAASLTDDMISIMKATERI